MIDVGTYILDSHESPLSFLLWVEDIIYFEGPLLSYYRTPKGTEHWFSLWADTDNNSDRWLVFEISQVTLEDYLEQRITLLDLINKPKSIMIYVHDVLKSSREINQVTVVTFSDLPINYIPSEDSFLDYDLVSAEVYERYGIVALNGDWGLDNLSSFANVFNKVYAFSYTLFNQTIYGVIGQYPWRGGYSQIGFFNRLLKSVPAPQINAFNYASPGYINLEVEHEPSKYLELSLFGYMQNRTDIQATMDDILSYIRQENLNAQRVQRNQIIDNLLPRHIEVLRRSLDVLASFLNMSDLLPHHVVDNGYIFGRTKAFLAYTRLLQELAEFHEDGLAQLVSVDNNLRRAGKEQQLLEANKSPMPRDAPF